VRHWRWDVFLSALMGVLAGALLTVQWLGHRPEPMVWPITAIVHRVDPSVVAVMNLEDQNGELKPHGLGTGVILSSHGEIVTNYHVVAGAAAVTVVLANGKRYPARVVGMDPPTDLAVVRIHATHLKPLAMSNSDQVQPGDLVVAIGNALGLSHTVTAGIVSARDRTLYRDGWEYHLIQTDAAINPGNSGGPLVNQAGLLIGINSSKIAQAGVEGLGFAIPVNTVRWVVHQILLYGRVRRPWLGIGVANAPSHSGGILITQVYPEGPAARAGVRPGDFLVKFNGKEVRSVAVLMEQIRRLRPGQRVQMDLMRGSRALQVTAIVEDRPSFRRAANGAQKPSQSRPAQS
jgi:serine protease Do